MKHLRYILSLVLVVATVAGVAQNEPPKVTSHISADTIMIGDRFTLTVEVEKDLMQNIIFPSLSFAPQEGNQSGEPSIEVIADLPADTLEREGRRERLRKRYEMTIYDEGIYKMGKAQVLYLGKNIVDTLFSEREERIVVNTFQIDSTMMSVRDLKPQMTLKFRFGEIAGYVGFALAAAALLVGIILLLVRYLHSRGRRISDLFKPTPPPPPHIVAIEALTALYNQKLWQNNKHKLYYSSLSDILRTYLAGAFEVGAMEMTTDEIVEALKKITLPEKARMDLVAVLRDADLVKFAKAMPEANDNELAYSRAYYFVEETKPVEKSEEEEEDKPTKNVKQ